MKTSFQQSARQFQRGVMAVEAAVVISFVLLPIMAFCLFFGRYLWYYTVAQKAAHDAALYLAGAPLSEIKAFGSPAIVLANSIIAAETADVDSSSAPEPTAICEFKTNPNAPPIWGNCNSTYAPLRVRAGVSMSVSDPIFSKVTFVFTKGTAFPIWADATMKYNGR